MIFSPADYAHASETTVQVSPSDSSTVTTIVLTPTATIEAAQIAITQAESTTAVIETQAQAITSPTETITATITQAQDSITQAQIVVDSATVAVAQVDSATVLVAEAEENVAIAEIAVDSQTAVVVINQDTLDTKESELSDLQSDGSPTITYTTPGYVEPVSQSSTVTTTTLPPMWDASTQIQTPFDIKMGDTLFNGQGTNSQIYVSSKAIISFGGPDYTFWDWPNATQDGIYVFQSDYMSAGTGASIIVKTTDVNLFIEWTLHRFGDSNGPLTYITWDMTVNPETGEWTGTGTMSGNTDVYGGPRTGIRQDNVLTELTPTTTGYDQEAVALKQEEVVVAQNELSIAQSALTILQNDLDASEQDLINAENNLIQAQNNLNTALLEIDEAISDMSLSITAAESLIRQTLANEEAERQVAEQARLAAIAAENARIAAQQAYEAEQTRIAAEAARVKAEAEAKAAAEAAAKAEADRIAAEEAAKKAEADRIAAEEAAAKAKAEAEKAEADKKAEELKAAQEAEAKAKAEVEAKLKSEEDAKKLAEQKAAEETKAKAEEAKAKAEADAKKAEQEKLDKLAEEANSGKELSTEEKAVVVEALLEDLKPGESISAAAIQASGVSYADLPPSTPIEVRTDENGNALVITAAVAANIELVQDPGALLTAAFTDPAAALAALGSIGADMTEAEREEATDMVIATVVAAGAAINAAAVAAGGATGGSTGGGGGSGGGSGANSPGSRGGRKW
jgi:hypothetical protein